MWIYEKKLQFPIKIKNPNPKMAQVILSQYGGLYGKCLGKCKIKTQILWKKKLKTYSSFEGRVIE